MMVTPAIHARQSSETANTIRVGSQLAISSSQLVPREPVKLRHWRRNALGISPDCQDSAGRAALAQNGSAFTRALIFARICQVRRWRRGNES